MSEPRPPRYLKPMNKVMMAVQRLGIPTGPAMVLTVPGHKSGRLRSTPMTPFEFRGGLYVVAGYPGADWAANARAAGTGTLSRGRRSRQVRIVELAAEEGAPGAAGFFHRSAGRCGVRKALGHGARWNGRRIRSAGGPGRRFPIRAEDREAIGAVQRRR